ncbi:MAG: 50S ribosomal protein L7ae [Nanoarchaeota archaeon]|nr:50S ribosomal protein L7ae [Nanoarchaeota archaeon]
MNSLYVLLCLNKMVDAYQIIEKARRTGKIEKGTNEVTKAIERGTAKFVAYASDVEPKEVIQHIPILCKEKKVPCQEVDNKQKLGIAAGISVPASSVVVVDVGEAEQDISGAK